MSDDITFCGSDCNNKKCFRHPSNIQEPRIPHSFAYLRDTEDCPYTVKKEMTNEEIQRALQIITKFFESGFASDEDKEELRRLVGRESTKWNNGYCECGGQWRYEQAVGHAYRTSYIYKCDKCGKIVEFYKVMDESEVTTNETDN